MKVKLLREEMQRELKEILKNEKMRLESTEREDKWWRNEELNEKKK